MKLNVFGLSFVLHLLFLSLGVDMSISHIRISVFFFLMPPHVLMNVRGFPRGCGDRLGRP